MKWLMAHYHACCAITRVRNLERIHHRFNRITVGRLNNFNIWLDALCKEMEHQTKSHNCTKEQAGHNSAEIDRLESLVRTLEIKLDETVQQLNRLAGAVQIHNDAGKMLNQRIDELESQLRMVRRPAHVLGPPSMN